MTVIQRIKRAEDPTDMMSKMEALTMEDMGAFGTGTLTLIGP